MSTIVDTPAIANEGQAREVAAIINTDGPERAAEILNQVAANGPVTAKAIRETARPTKTVTAPTRSDCAPVYRPSVPATA